MKSLILISGDKKFEVLVDDDDFGWISEIRWHIHLEVETYPKVFRNKKGDVGWTTARLHREIWERHFGLIPENMMIDHKDRNTLNNTKENLRIATSSQSSTNRGSIGKSRYKGVYQHKDGIRWCANIRKNGKKRYLGLYNTEEDAARAYDVAALELHEDQFVVLNFPK